MESSDGKPNIATHKNSFVSRFQRGETGFVSIFLVFLAITLAPPNGSCSRCQREHSTYDMVQKTFEWGIWIPTLNFGGNQIQCHFFLLSPHFKSARRLSEGRRASTNRMPTAENTRRHRHRGAIWGSSPHTMVLSVVLGGNSNKQQRIIYSWIATASIALLFEFILRWCFRKKKTEWSIYCPHGSTIKNHGSTIPLLSYPDNDVQ